MELLYTFLFATQMDTLGIEATPEEVDLMIDEIDQDNNGEIDFEGDSVGIMCQVGVMSPRRGPYVAVKWRDSPLGRCV